MNNKLKLCATISTIFFSLSFSTIANSTDPDTEQSLLEEYQKRRVSTESRKSSTVLSKAHLEEIIGTDKMEEIARTPLADQTQHQDFLPQLCEDA